MFLIHCSYYSVSHLQLSEELKQHLNQTMTENYAQPGKEKITSAVDRLQQDVWITFFHIYGKRLSLFSRQGRFQEYEH